MSREAIMYWLRWCNFNILQFLLAILFTWFKNDTKVLALSIIHSVHQLFAWQSKVGINIMNRMPNRLKILNVFTNHILNTFRKTTKNFKPCMYKKFPVPNGKYYCNLTCFTQSSILLTAFTTNMYFIFLLIFVRSL